MIFLNENDTDILFDLKEEVILKRDSRQIMYDGSGLTTEVSTYSTMNVTLTSIETSSLSSTQLSTWTETEASSSFTLVSNTFPTTTIFSTESSSFQTTPTYLPLSSNVITSTLTTTRSTIITATTGTTSPATGITSITTTPTTDTTSITTTPATGITSITTTPTTDTTSITTTPTTDTTSITTTPATGITSITTTPTTDTTSITTTPATGITSITTTPTTDTTSITTTPATGITSITTTPATDTTSITTTPATGSTSITTTPTTDTTSITTTPTTGSTSITTTPATGITSITTTPTTDTTSITTTPTTDTTSITTTPTTGTTSLTTTTTTTNSTCSNVTHITHDGRCVPKFDAQREVVNTLRSNTTNSTAIADALSIYISSITNSNMPLNPTYILRINEIDTYLSRIYDVNLTRNTTDSILVAQQPNQGQNVILSGASFTHGIGGKLVTNTSIDDVTGKRLSAAAIISNASLSGITSLNMLIIDTPTPYKNIDTNKTLASSVIVVTVQRNSSIFIPMNISLYFQVLNEYRPTIDAIYSCSYYDINDGRWNNSGCTTPVYNTQYDRYECSCNHFTSFALVWRPNVTLCDAATPINLNGTCVSKDAAEREVVKTLRSNTTNSTAIADALSQYISLIANSSTASNSTDTFSIGNIDTSLSKINNVTLILNNNDSILIAQPPFPNDTVTVLGASFTRDIGGELVTNTNIDDVTGKRLSAAAIISNESLSDIVSLNMLIIDNPTRFKNIDNSTNNNILVSSIIVVAPKRNNQSLPSRNISLYFQVFNESIQNSANGLYFCSFYDTYESQWNESGCTEPVYNKTYDRYECSCNHFTSFALIWRPNVPDTSNLNAQDIASLVFQSISIICFLFIIIHAIVIRFRNPLMSLRAYDLLPLISCASTTILFIFYIALGVTVYTKTSSSNEKECFLSSSVLMFFTYFFLIFMFCTKTSIGYFNYLRFVQLFPEPSIRKLFSMLIISFFISITWVAFAVGFNSNSSFKITELIQHKICWFTNNVIHYFLTIPVCLFLLINIILFIFVGIRIINYVRNANSSHQSYKRIKRCVLVLLSSCLSQGIGWIVGPLITLFNETEGAVLGWFFVVSIALEGLWTIILYIIIRTQHMDEQIRVTAYKESTKSTSLSSIKSKKRRKNDTNRSLRKRYQTTNEDLRRERHVFNDLYGIETRDRTVSEC